ncbi:hypothetical protein M408DRAFT_26241 [Serendipita vermifera MAFF 305830]|uniref:Uncharacterized protein n=1 Tax=Serendipita vermifera MAFF 305830 TaxID=933852 RepID=A0A0C3AZR0_SERVB|nr:hypothetical protein M408DRAFT_26241 [Serendipita vermifera MAFF 305830]
MSVATYTAYSSEPAFPRRALTRSIQTQNPDKVIHDIKHISREIARRFKAWSGSLHPGPLQNGITRDLAPERASLFVIKNYEYEEVFTKKPSAISQDEIYGLFFGAVELPPQPSLRIPKPTLRPVPVREVTHHIAYDADASNQITRIVHPIHLPIRRATGKPPAHHRKGVSVKDAAYLIQVPHLESRSLHVEPVAQEYEMERRYSPFILAIMALQRDGYQSHQPVPLCLDARLTLQFTVRVGDGHQLVSVRHLKWAGDYPVGTKLIKRAVVNGDGLRLQAFQNSLNAAFASKRKFSWLTGTPIIHENHQFLDPSPTTERPAKQFLYTAPIRQWDSKLTSTPRTTIRRRIQFRSPLVKVIDPEGELENVSQNPRQAQLILNCTFRKLLRTGLSLFEL